MSDQDESNPKLPDANEILCAASALARHLSASGIQFIPTADSDTVDKLASEFETPSVESESLPEKPPASQPAPKRNVKPPVAAPHPASPSDHYPLPVLTDELRIERLASMNQVVAACTRCAQLSESRTNTVFGEGNHSARVAFFGEGPGADEDRSGRPFVGRAGQLLTKMIEACTFAREDVYILNTVKCRPPGNRNPEPTELTNCREYFEQQLSIVQPEYVVCLGAIAAQTLLQTTEPVGRLRGRWHSYFASKVIVTYHPAYLLRNPAVKKAAWDDLKMMLADMGIKPR